MRFSLAALLFGALYLCLAASAAAQCPNVSISPDHREYQLGDAVVFRAETSGGVPASKMHYSWKVTGGSIVYGDGTDHIVVDSSTGQFGVSTYVEVTVGGTTCRQSAYEKVELADIPRPSVASGCPAVAPVLAGPAYVGEKSVFFASIDAYDPKWKLKYSWSVNGKAVGGGQARYLITDTRAADQMAVKVDVEGVPTCKKASANKSYAIAKRPVETITTAVAVAAPTPTPTSKSTAKCPSVQITAPSQIAEGEELHVSAKLTGGDPKLAPLYTWSVTSGRVKGEGQNVSVNTSGARGGAISVMLEVDHVGPGCLLNQTAFVLVTPEEVYHPKYTGMIDYLGMMVAVEDIAVPTTGARWGRLTLIRPLGTDGPSKGAIQFLFRVGNEPGHSYPAYTQANLSLDRGAFDLTLPKTAASKDLVKESVGAYLVSLAAADAELISSSRGPVTIKFENAVITIDDNAKAKLAELIKYVLK